MKKRELNDQNMNSKIQIFKGKTVKRFHSLLELGRTTTWHFPVLD